MGLGWIRVGLDWVRVGLGVGIGGSRLGKTIRIKTDREKQRY